MLHNEEVPLHEIRTFMQNRRKHLLNEERENFEHHRVGRKTYDGVLEMDEQKDSNMLSTH